VLSRVPVLPPKLADTDTSHASPCSCHPLLVYVWSDRLLPIPSADLLLCCDQSRPKADCCCAAAAWSAKAAVDQASRVSWWDPACVSSSFYNSTQRCWTGRQHAQRPRDSTATRTCKQPQTTHAGCCHRVGLHSYEQNSSNNVHSALKPARKPGIWAVLGPNTGQCLDSMLRPYRPHDHE
jgi:hypothetical protein